MKYYFLVIVIFIQISCLYAQENISVSFSQPVTIHYNENRVFNIIIENRGNEQLSNINIEILPNELLVISPTEFSISSLSARGSITFPLNINSNKRKYFSESISVKANIITDNYTQERTISVTLSPAKHFWLKISFVVAFILLAIMLIVYIKLMKGEK